MARRYARDNRGRFAPKGSGATARGGRLKTASGKKRESQTMQASAAPKGTIGKPRGLKPGSITIDIKPRLKRTGKTIKVARAKPPKPTKEDRAIEKVASLKAATKIGGRAKLTFVPDSALTPARRKALGLSAFASESGSQRYRVSRQTFGNERGVAISERSSYQARLPKTRQGVVRRRSPSSAKPARAAATGRGGKVKGGGRPSGIGAIPKGDLKRYRMLQNKINPLRDSLDRDGSTMVGSTNRKLADQASARYSQNLKKLNRITSTMRRLSNSPDSANIPRLPRVASVGKRLGRTAAIKKMDGPRKFGGQSWRDLRGQYSGGRVQYEDNYMNKLYNRKNKGSTIRSSRPTGTIRAASARPKQARALAAPTGSRTRSQAKAVQRSRRNNILDRARPWSGRNPGIKRSDTGMRQLSLTGPSKTLYSFKRTKLGRKPR